MADDAIAVVGRFLIAAHSVWGKLQDAGRPSTEVEPLLQRLNEQQQHLRDLWRVVKSVPESIETIENIFGESASNHTHCIAWRSTGQAVPPRLRRQ